MNILVHSSKDKNREIQQGFIGLNFYRTQLSAYFDN